MNLGCLFWLSCVSVHTQSRPKGAAPSGEVRWLCTPFQDLWRVCGVPWVYAAARHIYSDLRQMIDILLRTSSVVFNALCNVWNVVAFWCSCMLLCSQGPHLWPFISSQVKGLRDSEAHRLTAVWPESSRCKVLHNIFKIQILSKHGICDVCHVWFSFIIC